MNHEQAAMEKNSKHKARVKVARMWIDHMDLGEEDVEKMVQMLSHYSHVEACRPFVVIDLRNGVGRSVLLARYCLKDHELRRIGIDAGIYKPKRF